MRVREPQEMLEAACHIAVEKGGFRMAWIGFVDSTTKSVKPVAHAGVADDYLEKLNVVLGDDPRGHGPIAVALHDGTHVVCNDIEHDPRMTPWQEDARRLGYRALAVLPLTVRGERVGTFNLYASEPAFFDDEEMRLLDELATDIGFALEVSQQEAERQRVGAALRASEERYRTLAETAQDIIYIINREFRVTYINEYGARQFGRSTLELTGRHLTELFPRETTQWQLREMAGVFRTGESLHRERHLPFGRQPMWLDTRLVPVKNAIGEVESILGISRNITERKLAEEALRRSESQFRLIWENSVDGMRLTDGAGNVLLVNEAFCRLVGKPRAEIEGKPMCDIYAEANREHILARHRERFASRSVPAHSEQRLKFWDGREVWVEVGNCFFEPEPSRPVLLGLFRDVTGRKLAEGQMLRTQRLESIGTLAGGVAHDLNNALAPIMMATELLRLQFPDTASNYLDLIQAGAKRGADMVKQLLTFAKGAEGERLLLQPRHLLKEMDKLMQGTFPKNIELRTRYAKDLRTILGDATQLHQVLLNLCVNARDAMPEGGTLTLDGENVEIDPIYADAVTEAKPGRYVVWRVMDTGTGIPPEVLDRIFEPFFTTKGPDKGTGLGLSTVIGIVKGHGGFIRVYSVPGQGSTFAVYLPAYGSAAGDAPLLTQAEPTFRGTGETILVVDDEASVREVMRAVLTALNFKVITAGDGTEALVQVAEKRAELRAVITDLHMPHMDGLSLVRVLRARLPQAGIIVVSGRLDEREANEFKALGVSALLDKPFTQEKLVAALKTVFLR